MKEENISSDGECVSLDDSDEVLATLKECCSEKKEIYDQLYRFLWECSQKGRAKSGRRWSASCQLVIGA